MKLIIEEVHMKFIEDENIRRSLKIGIDALNDLDLWEWLSAFTLYNDMFIMRNHHNLELIEHYMSDHGDHHSGASFGMIMRNLQMISKYGWAQFVEYTEGLLLGHASDHLLTTSGNS